ncbi:hypothetical protein AYO47_08155 [Planctomyces sp. SCGC AG-212-M04]|nr:hypothetical protein AYO47_08155 [Planctomyces sp. SCGC AG-212-M04]
MSLFVLDSSVAVGFSSKALDLRDAVKSMIHEIIAPETFASEVAHALTKAERRKVIPIGDAAVHLTDILSVGPRLEPFLPLLPRAIEISSATRIAVGDCLFLAVAEKEGCELVTADNRLLINAKGFPVVSLQDFTV